MDILYPYVKNTGIFKCPNYQGYWAFESEPNVFGYTSPYVKSMREYHMGYGLNALILLGYLKGLTPYTLAEIERPAEVGLIGDTYGMDATYIGYCLDVGEGYRRYWLNTNENGPFAWYGPARHSEGTDIVFADGHAKWARRSLTKESDLFWGYFRVKVQPDEASCR
jgi:prepilin-type processing-associated H-X9-DG protein